MKRGISRRAFWVWIAALAAQLCSAQPSTRPAIPDPSAQARAQRAIDEVYQKELASNSVAQRRELARKLLDQADGEADLATKYVLLRNARDIAAAAGDAAGTCGAVRRMCEQFACEAAPMKLAAVRAAIRSATNIRDCAAGANLCIASAEEAIVADDYASAGKLLAIAQGAAQRTRSAALISTVESRSRELREITTEAAKIPAAREKLKQNPDDPAANLLLGRHLCLVKEDWTAGLPVLSRCGAAGLAAAAAADLEEPIDAKAAMEVGDAWWAIAQKQSPLAQRSVRARAVKWYRQALGGLDGLGRSIASKRIEEFELQRLSQMGLARGLAAELYTGTDFARRIRLRVDPHINFEWGLGAPDASLPKDNFSIRWTGMLRVSGGGKYQLTIIANGGARLWIDGKLALDASTAGRARNGVHAAVELSEGLHPIRVDFWDTTGIARMKLHWQTPGATEREPIPAAALYHELADELE